MKIRINKSVVRRQLDRLKVHCKITPAGCWEWQRSRFPTGYGQVRAFGRNYYTHRLALKFDGRLSEGKHACHRCDNPPCCNPSHLFAGTRKDNFADAVSKGRIREGEAHGMARLTAAQVAEIRSRYHFGETQRVLAKKFGVVQGYVSLIVNRKIWKSV